MESAVETSFKQLDLLAEQLNASCDDRCNVILIYSLFKYAEYSYIKDSRRNFERKANKNTRFQAIS